MNDFFGLLLAAAAAFLKGEEEQAVPFMQRAWCAVPDG
jgi:hypothetical protein